MQPMTTIRNHARLLTMASMFALALSGLPAVHAYAQPNNGAGGADTRPDNATCALVTAGFYDCTTPDGGEWYCTNDTDPSACVQIKSPSTTVTGVGTGFGLGTGVIRPVNGGIFVGAGNAAPASPHLPVSVAQIGR